MSFVYLASIKKFIENEIFGIDLMYFATNMTSINLESQNLQIPATPNIFPLNGIETMLKISESPNEIMLENKKIPRYFDMVVMNPPFTRRDS